MITSLIAVERVLASAVEQSPFTAETIAIDVTNALRAAGSGLRGFRSRSLLRRLWHDLTGTSQELQSAISSDLVTVQRGTLKLVKEIMREEARTQFCVESVLHNLHAVNQDLDELAAQTTRDRHGANLRLADLQVKFYEALKAESQHLAGEIESVRYSLQREAVIRRLRDQFLGGDLHPGTGEILSGALYMAHSARYFADESPQLRQEEWMTSLAVLKQRIGTRSEYLPDLFHRAVEEIQQEALETIAYLSSRDRGPALTVFNSLVERRMAEVRLDIDTAEESLTIVRELHDPAHRLATSLFRPWELAEQVAIELLNLPLGGKQ